MDMTHISLHLDSAVAKAARIQAIKDEVSITAWIIQAIMRQLAVSEGLPAEAAQVGKPEREAV